MSLYEVRPCPCGSGLPSRWETDARGIPLCRTCPSCRAKKLQGYRPEVLTNPRYDLMGERLNEEDP